MQELSEEMQRLLKKQPRKTDQSIGGIPIDSEYIIFIIEACLERGDIVNLL